MTGEDLIWHVRRNVRTFGRIVAIREVRKLGFTFPTARTIVDEVTENKPWYKNQGKKKPRCPKQ